MNAEIWTLCVCVCVWSVIIIGMESTKVQILDEAAVSFLFLFCAIVLRKSINPLLPLTIVGYTGLFSYGKATSWKGKTEFQIWGVLFRESVADWWIILVISTSKKVWLICSKTWYLFIAMARAYYKFNSFIPHWKIKDSGRKNSEVKLISFFHFKSFTTLKVFHWSE